MAVLQMTRPPQMPRVMDFDAATNFNALDQATRVELLTAFQKYAIAIGDRVNTADTNALKAAVLKHISAFTGAAANLTAAFTAKNLTEISHPYVNAQGKSVTDKILLVKRNNQDTSTFTRPELASCLIASYNAAASGARTARAIQVT